MSFWSQRNSGHLSPRPSYDNLYANLFAYYYFRICKFIVTTEIWSVLNSVVIQRCYYDALILERCVCFIGVSNLGS
jgi:hypothetical protein